MVNFTQQVGTVLLGVGGNSTGSWGDPSESMARACRELEAAGLKIMRSSGLYLTEPVGGGRQPPYLNAVILVAPGMAPSRLLRLVKQIERRAGRRLGPPNSARPVDLDLLACGGQRLNWPAVRREPGRLVLPHPLLHTRTFVLVPLLEVAPHWRHPVLGYQARTLLAKLNPRARSRVERVGAGLLNKAARALPGPRLRTCRAGPRNGARG